MSKREKIFNICIVLFISIAIILGIGVVSNAAKNDAKNEMVPDKTTKYSNDWRKPDISSLQKNDTFSLSMNELDAGRESTGEEKGLFCIEHKEKMSHRKYKTYNVVNVLEIDGYSVNSTTNNAWNGGQGENLGELTAKLAAGIFYSEKDERQRAIWYYMFSWVEEITKNPNIGKGLSIGMVNKVNERN